MPWKQYRLIFQTPSFGIDHLVSAVSLENEHRLALIHYVFLSYELVHGLCCDIRLRLVLSWQSWKSMLGLSIVRSSWAVSKHRKSCKKSWVRGLSASCRTFGWSWMNRVRLSSDKLLRRVAVRGSTLTKRNRGTLDYSNRNCAWNSLWVLPLSGSWLKWINPPLPQKIVRTP